MKEKIYFAGEDDFLKFLYRNNVVRVLHLDEQVEIGVFYHHPTNRTSKLAPSSLGRGFKEEQISAEIVGDYRDNLDKTRKWLKDQGMEYKESSANLDPPIMGYGNTVTGVHYNSFTFKPDKGSKQDLFFRVIDERAWDLSAPSYPFDGYKENSIMGVSFEGCVLDIALGLMKEENVNKIFVPIGSNFESLVDGASSGLWKNVPDEAVQIANRLFEKGKFVVSDFDFEMSRKRAFNWFDPKCYHDSYVGYKLYEDMKNVSNKKELWGAISSVLGDGHISDSWSMTKAVLAKFADQDDALQAFMNALQNKMGDSYPLPLKHDYLGSKHSRILGRYPNRQWREYGDHYAILHETHYPKNCGALDRDSNPELQTLQELEQAILGATKNFAKHSIVKEWPYQEPEVDFAGLDSSFSKIPEDKKAYYATRALEMLFKNLDSGSYKIAEYLLKKGADANIFDKQHKRPVIFNALYNNVRVDIAQLLLDYGAKPDSFDIGNQRYLLGAIGSDSIESGHDIWWSDFVKLSKSLINKVCKQELVGLFRGGLSSNPMFNPDKEPAQFDDFMEIINKGLSLSLPMERTKDLEGNNPSVLYSIYQAFKLYDKQVISWHTPAFLETLMRSIIDLCKKPSIPEFEEMAKDASKKLYDAIAKGDVWAENSWYKILEMLGQIKVSSYPKPKGLVENPRRIFCDLGGTLFIEGKLNQELYDRLVQCQNLGVEVNIWTGAYDLREYQALLDKLTGEKRFEIFGKSRGPWTNSGKTLYIDDLGGNDINIVGPVRAIRLLDNIISNAIGEKSDFWTARHKQEQLETRGQQL